MTGEAFHLLLLLLLLLFISNAISVAEAIEFHWISCDTTANFSTNSTFQQNLSKTLPFLTNSTSQTGFSTTTIGDTTNSVTALAICRGDLGQSDCQDCIETASLQIRQRCPNQTTAQIWFDNCWLRYSNSSSFSDYDGTTHYFYPSSRSAPNPDAFNNRLGDLMDRLSHEAAAVDSRFVTGKTRLSDFNWIHGLVQCERDLTELQCTNCLAGAVAEIPSCCAGNWSGLVGSTSCSIRFSLDLFYNESGESSPSPTPTPLVQMLVVPPGERRNSTGGGGGKGVAIGVAAAALVVVASFVGLCLWLVVNKRKRRGRGGRRKRGVVDKVARENGIEMGSFLFDFQSLVTATDGFSNANRLGQGGFGPVYKGKLPDGNAIAVKKLSVGSTQGVQEFMNEVKLLVKLEHRNLVMLLGCCIDGGEKMLVYEYLPNKSLDNYLFNKRKSILLDWPKRFNIIMGIARGLLYLHQESKHTIIHRDIKASNILLDEQMEPKISDFGLARLFHGEVTHADTRTIAGTYGYMAPEYARRGLLSAKCDVYSFGVLVLEILSGRKNFDERLEEKKQELIRHAWRLKREGKLIELMDPSMGSCPQDVILKCSEIGLLCCEANVESRPSMASVLIMLSNNSTTVPRPRNPGFGSTINTRIHSRERSSIPSKLGNRSNHVSWNYMSASDFDGR